MFSSSCALFFFNAVFSGSGSAPQVAYFTVYSCHLQSGNVCTGNVAGFVHPARSRTEQCREGHPLVFMVILRRLLTEMSLGAPICLPSFTRCHCNTKLELLSLSHSLSLSPFLFFPPLAPSLSSFTPEVNRGKRNERGRCQLTASLQSDKF